MVNAGPPVTPPPPPPREFSPFAGLLSYLIPGLGQLSQGRTGKGLLFFVCIYALFFYGMYLGTGTVRAEGVEYHVSGNVYLPDSVPPGADQRLVNPYNLPTFALNLYNRPQYAGQFWVGVVSWPAMFQYAGDQRARARIQELHSDAGHLEPDQPEEAGRLRAEAERLEQEFKGPGKRLFGDFERAPTVEELNALNTSRGKELELGWVYTVIAGVLNIMVIYDAMAGPALVSAKGS
jgi:hypothetical protein